MSVSPSRCFRGTCAANLRLDGDKGNSWNSENICMSDSWITNRDDSYPTQLIGRNAATRSAPGTAMDRKCCRASMDWGMSLDRLLDDGQVHAHQRANWAPAPAAWYPSNWPALTGMAWRPAGIRLRHRHRRHCRSSYLYSMTRPLTGTHRIVVLNRDGISQSGRRSAGIGHRIHRHSALVACRRNSGQVVRSAANMPDTGSRQWAPDRLA